jgi:biopolymer transport protein ExbD
MSEYREKFGSETRIQLDDAFAEVSEVGPYISNEWGAMSENDKKQMTVSIKADKNTQMKVITDVKEELRKVHALKINYAAVERTSY